MTIRSGLLAVTLPFLGWISVLMVVAVMSDRTPAYVVLLPGERFMHGLPRETSITSASGFSVTLTSTAPGFARTLYGSGAWIVLPAGLRGCATQNAPALQSAPPRGTYVSAD